VTRTAPATRTRRVRAWTLPLAVALGSLGWIAAAELLDLLWPLLGTRGMWQLVTYPAAGFGLLLWIVKASQP
jgi:hypothetical protein